MTHADVHSLVICIQEVNGIQFAHIKKKELYFVISSLKRNLSPAMALELLEAIVSVSTPHKYDLKSIHIYVCAFLENT